MRARLIGFLALVSACDGAEAPNVDAGPALRDASTTDAPDAGTAMPSSCAALCERIEDCRTRRYEATIEGAFGPASCEVAPAFSGNCETACRQIILGADDQEGCETCLRLSVSTACSGSPATCFDACFGGGFENLDTFDPQSFSCGPEDLPPTAPVCETALSRGVWVNPPQNVEDYVGPVRIAATVPFTLDLLDLENTTVLVSGIEGPWTEGQTFSARLDVYCPMWCFGTRTDPSGSLLGARGRPPSLTK